MAFEPHRPSIGQSQPPKLEPAPSNLSSKLGVTPPKGKKGLQISVVIVVIIMILVCSYWLTRPTPSPTEQPLWDPGFDVDALITPEDKAFYEQYPQAPMVYDLTKKTISQTCDIIFEKPALYGEDLPIFNQEMDQKKALYDWVIEAAQITPSIENLAQRVLQDVGNDRVEQAKAIFNFVSCYLWYSIDGAYEFPVTSLLEREGQCSEYATLLTSLYIAAGFRTCYVFTATEASKYFELYHIWVALYLPEFTPTDPGQDIVTSRLGEGWVGLDTTGNQCLFGELYGILDYHSNIVSIVEPVTSVTIYDIEADWDHEGTGNTRSVHLEVYLKTWDSNNKGSIDLTFRLYENDAVSDTASYSLNEFIEANIDVDLIYYGTSWEGEGKQYITISVT